MTQTSQQADRCPFPRPFAADFDGCPAFQPATFVATDSHNVSLGTWQTCRHLTTGTDQRQTGRFYPRCALGTSEERIRWVAEVTPARLEVVRTLQEEFDRVSLPHQQQLSNARSHFREAPFWPEPDADIERIIHDFLDCVDRFLVSNADRLQDAGLPGKSLSKLIKEWIWAWMRTPEYATARVSDAWLERIEPGARAFLGLPAKIEPASFRRLKDQPVFNDAILQILPTVEPRGLALVGDVDASNIPALAYALNGLRDGQGDVHLDLSDLLFCDLGGLQAIVRAAQALPAGRRMILYGIPRQVEHALELLDWAPLPNLLIDGTDT